MVVAPPSSPRPGAACWLVASKPCCAVLGASDFAPPAFLCQDRRDPGADPPESSVSSECCGSTAPAISMAPSGAGTRFEKIQSPNQPKATTTVTAVRTLENSIAVSTRSRSKCCLRVTPMSSWTVVPRSGANDVGPVWPAPKIPTGRWPGRRAGREWPHSGSRSAIWCQPEALRRLRERRWTQLTVSPPGRHGRAGGKYAAIPDSARRRDQLT